MNTMWKRSLAMFLSVVMVFGMLPVNAFATEGCEHVWDEGTVTAEANCTANGEKTFTCITCGETTAEVIASNGHSFVDGVCDVCGKQDENNQSPVTAVAANSGSGCKLNHADPQNYNKTGTCVVCGEALLCYLCGGEAEFEHHPAECLKPEFYYVRCLNNAECSWYTNPGYYNNGCVTTPLGHDDAWEYQTFEPTCKDDGYKTRVCTRCGYKDEYYWDYLGPATGVHTYGEDGRCTGCGGSAECDCYEKCFEAPDVEFCALCASNPALCAGELHIYDEYTLSNVLKVSGEYKLDDESLIYLSDTVVVPAGVKVTLDLRGSGISNFKWVGYNQMPTDKYAIRVEEGAELTITDTLLENGGSRSEFYGIENHGTLTIKGGNIIAPMKIENNEPVSNSYAINNFGNVTIDEGAGYIQCSADPYRWPLAVNNDAELVIKSGWFIYTDDNYQLLKSYVPESHHVEKFEYEEWDSEMTVMPGAPEDDGSDDNTDEGGTIPSVLYIDLTGRTGPVSKVEFRDAQDEFIAEATAMHVSGDIWSVDPVPANAVRIRVTDQNGEFGGTIETDGTNCFRFEEGSLVWSTYEPEVEEPSVEVPDTTDEEAVSNIITGSSDETPSAEAVAAVKKVIAEIAANTAVKFNENVPDGASLSIELTGVAVKNDAPTGRLVFDVKPVDASGKQVTELNQAITFRLPVPSTVQETLANVYHNGALMDTYDIEGEGNARYVEVSSAEFSEYAVEPTSEAPSTAVAVIDNQGYNTLADALTAASAMTGDVTVEIYEKVTLDQELSGSFDSIKFVGKDTNAEIYLDLQGAVYATGKTVAFETLKLSKVAGGYIPDAGFMNLAFGIYAADEVTYTNCTFANGAYASFGEVTFKGCTFYRSHDRYGLWAYGAEKCVVEDCTFADFRGIKLFAEGNKTVTNLTVKDTDFSAVDNKPAIVLTSGKSVTLEGNTYSSTGVFELDLKGVPNGTAVTSDVTPTCVNDNGACGVLVDGKIYTTVADAADVATSGNTVTLLHESTETVVLPQGVVLEKNGFTAEGVTVYVPEIAQIGGKKYESLEAALVDAQAGDEIVLLADVAEDFTLPAGVIFNGNGKQVGVITAAGEVTFKGHTKAANFATQYTNTTINIPVGACLEITGTGRLVIGHGCTFNITGTITDAKTADKATIQPSLIMPGASFTGAGVTFNVTNAYIKAPSSYCSSSKSASGTFDFNITNSIIETAGKLAFESQSTAATVNFELKDSALNTGSYLIFGVSRGEVVIDNSNVNVGKSNQLENQSTMTIKNGSVVNGAVATSSNAKNPGTVIVDNATYAVTGEFSGSDLGTGTLIVKNGATVSAGSITNANIQIDATGMQAGAEVNLTANLSKLAGTLEVINNDKLEANIVDGKIVLAAKPVAKIGEQGYATMEEAFAAATEGQTITLLADATPALTSQRAITKAATIDLGGKTLTLTEDDLYFGTTTFENGTIVVDPSVKPSTAVFWMFENQTLTFDAVKIVATGVTGTYLIGLDGNNSDLNLLNGSEILIENTTALDLDVICVTGSSDNDIVIADSKVNVKNLDGRVFFCGNYTVSGNSDIDLSGITKAGFRIEAGQTLTIADTATVDIVGEPRDGGIHLTDLTATYTKADTATVNATVNKPKVAKIGDTPYATLEAAVAAAAEGDTIVLLSNIELTETVTVPADKDIILDLNGKTINAAFAEGSETNHIYVIENKGELTITGNGTINTRGIRNYGTLTLENGTINAIDGNGGYGVVNYEGAKMIMNGGTIATTLEDDHKVDEGGHDATTVRVEKGATFVMNGGTITNICDYTFAIDNYGTATINDGTVTSVHSTVSSYGTLTVNGGTFTCNGLEGVTAHALVVWNGSETTINGGTFDGKDNFNGFNVDADEGATVEIKGGTFLAVHSGSLYGDGTILVSGGTFFDEIDESRCAEGYAVQKNEDGTYGVQAKPVIPTATVTPITNQDLTFALNFKADNATEEQLKYYKDWFADYVLTVNKDVTFNANGGADGYLSGQYDAWSENWVDVPTSDVTLKAGESLKIMEYAAKLMNKPGLKLTYADVYNSVKDFDCGVFFEPEFLAANPDLEVKLELRMYDPEDETNSAVIGETYTFEAADVTPDLPTATVTSITNQDLTFALNFKADTVNAHQLAYYGDWFADYVLTVNKDVTFNANGGADGYLSGQYDAWSENWVDVPTSDVTLKAGESLKIMEYAAKLMNKPGLKLTYADVYNSVKDFDCGVYFEPEFLEKNPDLKITLELRMYDPADENNSAVIGETYNFTATDALVAKTKTANVFYANLQDALDIAEETGDTVLLLKDLVVPDSKFDVEEGVTFDLNGYKLSSKYMTVYGDIVDNSDSNSGRLIVAKETRFLLQESNAHLPVKTAEGFAFIQILKFNTAIQNDGSKFVFQPMFEPAAHEILKQGAKVTGVTVNARVSWETKDGIRTQDFEFNDEYLNKFLNSYKPATGKYGQMFSLTLTNAASLQNLAFSAAVTSATVAEKVSDSVNPNPPAVEQTGNIVKDANNQVTKAVNLTNENSNASAVVPSGTTVEATANTLTLQIQEMEKTTTNITVDDGETMLSLNVHVDGVAADNKAPILVTLPEITELNLNQGNIHLYHVENGETIEMTRVSTMDELVAHNQFYYDPNTRTVTLSLATFSEVAVVANTTNAWNGGFDYSWYDAENEAYEIFNADQLAAFGAIVDGTAKDDGKDIEQNSFEKKTIKLMADIDLGGNGEESDISFNPIGHGTEGKKFMGTFDGNGCTISNLYQNGWALGLTYSTAGGGLFAYAENATFKNLTLDSAYIVMECIDMGTLVGYAYGTCHFENILVKNSTIANYNRYTGGVVGEVNGNHTFINVDVDADTTVSALWGTFDPGVGGIIGGKYGEASVTMKRCHVACKLDVYNDVTSAYQWYSYRRCGMLIGYTEESEKEASGRTVATAEFLTTEDCTVSYGDWAKYTYCEFGAERYPFVRVEEGLFNGAYSNARYGNPVGKSGDKVSAEHEFTIEHNDGEAHNLQIVFNQLYGGGQGCYGGNGHIGKGVTVVDAPAPVEKFVSKVNEKYTVSNGQTVRLGDLFDASSNIPADQEIQNFYVHAFVTPATETTTARATLARNEQDWKESTLTFSGNGVVRITINDYYYCTPTIINISVGERVEEAKFTHAFPNTETYLYRIGNKNEVKLSSLFKENEASKFGITDKVTITVEKADGTKMDPISANAETWKNQEIKMTGYTGLIKVTIQDDDPYCTPTELNLEVVSAVNATSATSATSNNVVLLNDCGFGSLEVKNGYTLYGNGFILTASSDQAARNMSYGFVQMENGTLDNVQIKCPDFAHAILYSKNADENNNPTDADGRYYNIRSAIVADKNSKILNSYISGGRAAVYASSGTLLIANTTIEGGAAANIHTGTCNLTLSDVTLIQEPKKATTNGPDAPTTETTLMGLSVVAMCDASGVCVPITLDGTINQYAWANEDCADYVPSDGKSFIPTVLGEKDYVHKINGEDSLNLGFLFIPASPSSAAKDPVANSMIIDHRSVANQWGAVYVNPGAYVYSLKKTTDENTEVTKPDYSANTQDASLPTVNFTDSNDARIFETTYDVTNSNWVSTLKVDVDQGEYSFSFDKLLVQKYGEDLTYTVAKVDGTSIDKSTAITLNDSVTMEYVLTITDNQIYDQNGTKIENASVNRTHVFKILATKTSIAAPSWVSTTLTGTGLVVADNPNDNWQAAVPVLDGLSVKYWSKAENKEKELKFSDITFAKKGKQNEANNSITIESENEYTLVITTSGFKDNPKDNGMPVVVENNGEQTLYFTVASSGNYVSRSSTSRTITINYTFTDANNTTPLTKTLTMTVEASSDKTGKEYSDFCNGTLKNAESCVTPDTLITLADGSLVRVDSLTGNEELLVWNLETGKLDSAPILFVDSDPEEEMEIVHLYFSDGTDVKVIYEHGFWDYDLNKYVYLDANAAQYIGHTFAKQNGEELTKVQLTDVVLETEYTSAWSPVTAGHLCYFVNGMLSMPGGVGGLFNIFEVDPETMTYDPEAMARDIETYGLFTYEEMNQIVPLSETMFETCGGAYLKVSIGKGNMTIDDLIYMVNRYSEFFN